MLHSISWQTYFSSAAILMAGYYIAIWFLYFKKRTVLDKGDHLIFQQSKESPFTSSANHSSYLPNENAGATLVKEDTILSASDQSFLDEMEALTAATGEAVDNATLVSVIQSLIKKYPSLKDSADLAFVNAAISDACKRNCAVDLSKENIKQLWFG